jgi:glycosyltransferase involved in cell wall biosynthesis
MHFDILFRSCDREFRQTQRNIEGSKQDIILGCLTSILQSVELSVRTHSECAVTYKLTVVDDGSSDSTVQQIHGIMEQWPGPTKFVTTPSCGNGASIGFNLDWARQHCHDLIYFVEDDYIHLPPAISSLTDNWQHFASLFQQPVVLFPVDYPDRYMTHMPQGLHSATQLYLGRDRHWRTISSTTGTMLMHRDTLHTYWHCLSPFRYYGVDASISEANTINQVYQHVPCLSPVPTLAEHIMQADHSSPFVNWQEVWQTLINKETTTCTPY